MHDVLVMDGGVLRDAAARLRGVGDVLPGTVVDDVAACGSPAVARAARELALRLVWELRRAGGDVVWLSTEADDAAVMIEATDSRLAAAAR